MKLTAAILTLLLTMISTAAEKGLQVGTAAVDISPTVFPIQLRSGPSNYVHDPMHVRAIAFQNGEGRAAIALIDAIGAGQEMTAKAKTIVAERTGWKVEEILVSGTHAHTTPKGGDTSPGRIAYETTRFDGLVSALTTAIESLEPAQVGFASEDEPSEVRNRRWYLKKGTMEKNPFGTYDKVRMNPNPATIDAPAGPIDPEVCIIDIRNRRGKPLGLVANYSLHYVGNIPKVIEEDGEEVGMASADYFGEFSRIFPYRTAGSNSENHFVAMMTNGTSGDINNIDFHGLRGPRAPFEQVRQVATKTADAAWRASKKIASFDINPLVAMKQRSVSLKYRSMREDEVERALRLLEMTQKERDGLDLHQKFTEYANATLRYSEPNKTEEVLIQAIRIGDQAIVSLPFEVLVEIGLELKKKSPFPHTFTISLANGGYGYLPPPNQFDLGGYETWIGTCRFERDSSVILVKHLLEMLEELKALD